MAETGAGAAGAGGGEAADGAADRAPSVAVVACRVLEDEINGLLAGMPGVRAVRFFEYQLHTQPELLRRVVQEGVFEAEADPGVEAVVLAYGLCSRAIEGILARRARLVMARAHDCITLLLGSKERYAAYVRDHPATYWYSLGWNRSHLPPGKARWDAARAAYEAKYDPEDVEFLMEAEQAWMKEYRRATFVEMGLGDPAEIEREAEHTRRCAEWLGWEYDRQKGDPGLLRDLLSGKWDDGRFLVLQPGEVAQFTADDAILRAGACASCPLGGGRGPEGGERA